MSRWRLGTLFAVCCALIAFAAIPAGAHDPEDGDHPGRYIPSPESKTKHMHLLGSAPKTFDDPAYRNSDLAFWGNLAYAGNYRGFRIIDISDPEAPVVLTDFDCPGLQHDVSVWGGLMFLSIDSPRTSPACDSAPSPSGTPGFEGVRIFDVSNPRAPEFIGGVATDCGSHTHTLVPDVPNGRVLLYVASYPAGILGPSVYGNECRRLNPDGSQGHSKISVVEVDLTDPASASVVSEPRFELNDLRATPGFRGCHDITVFMELELAGAACNAEGQIWDISNLEQPQTIARIHNPNVEFWHSAAFTWDGEMVVFGDEAGGGTQPRCRSTDPATLGAAWFYRVDSLDNADGSSVEPWAGTFKIPRVQGEGNCTTHNFNFIPTKHRYVWVSSYYAGGTTVVDVTDPARPREVGHLDPHGANTWSSYWYNNFIYTNDGGRGFDVMLLSAKESAAAQRLPRMNPQTQERTL